LITGPDRVRKLGVIATSGDNGSPRIRLEVEGRRVTVTATTYGNGCYTAGDTELAVRGLEAEITPYDYTEPAGSVCTQQLRIFEHRVTVAFESSGTARVRIRGINDRTRRAGNMVGDTLVVERLVEVP
jgi:hypothetical protein